MVRVCASTDIEAGDFVSYVRDSINARRTAAQRTRGTPGGTPSHARAHPADSLKTVRTVCFALEASRDHRGTLHTSQLRTRARRSRYGLSIAAFIGIAFVLAGVTASDAGA